MFLQNIMKKMEFPIKILENRDTTEIQIGRKDEYEYNAQIAEGS